MFSHFDFHMCPVPQKRALFRHLNVQNCSEIVSFNTLFWLQNVIRATTACTFSTSQLPKVSDVEVLLTFWLRTCLAPHGRAIFHLSSGQMAQHPWAYFSSLRSHKTLEKHSVLRLCYLFAHLHLLFSDPFSSLIFFFFSSLLWLFPPLLFHLSILPEVWLLNFLRSYSQSGILPFEFYVHKVQYSINIARNWVKDCSASWDSTSCVHCFNMGVSWRRSVQTSQHFADLGHLGHLGTSESKVISIPGLYRLDNIYLD